MRKQQAGFTLMEMIGVVAVIAILASMATPMIFDAIRNARVTAFIEDVNVARTAVARYYEDTGQFPSHVSTDTSDGARLLLSNSTNSPVGGWNGPYIDTDIRNPFDEGGYRAILNSDAANLQFDLDGDGNLDTSGVSVMRVDNVSDRDARKISDILDSDADVTSGSGAWFAAGRVKRLGGQADNGTLLIFLSRD